MSTLFTGFPLLDAPTDPNNPFDRARNRKTINLFKNPDKIGHELSLEEEIGETIQLIKTYASTSSEIFIQELQWPHEFFLNYIDDDLYDSIMSDLNHDFGTAQFGGPLTFV